MLPVLNPVEQLDTVLKYLSTDRGNASLIQIKTGVNKIFTIDGDDLLRILNKLASESLVHIGSFPRERPNVYGEITEYKYSISFDGKLFIQNGGYKEKIYSDKVKQEETISRNQRTERNEVQLVTWTRNLAERTADLTFWTRLVAIGAIGLVVWEIVQFFLEHRR